MAGVGTIPHDYVDLSFWDKFPRKYNSKIFSEGTESTDESPKDEDEAEPNSTVAMGHATQNDDYAVTGHNDDTASAATSAEKNMVSFILILLPFFREITFY